MSTWSEPACVRHRDTLIGFVDRREISPATDAALDHLDRCDRCTRELEGIAEAIHALRGLGREAAAMDPPDAIWPTIEARARRPGEPAWRWRMPLAGLVATAAVVALLAGPGAVWRTRLAVMQEAGTDAALLAEQRNATIQLERRFQRYRVPFEAVAPPRDQEPPSVPPRYPDDWVPARGSSASHTPIDPAIMVRVD
jgi:anti-sigma factor RsiW